MNYPTKANFKQGIWGGGDLS